MDVRDSATVADVVAESKPDVIFHLAGAKHAPVGETEPLETLFTNSLGTANIINAANGARVVLASTCKAINPETAYGASKLLAERMTLNYGNGAVARFHNVVETQGNVFDFWENDWGGTATSHYGTYPVTDCWRYFITKDEALTLLLYAAVNHRGLYSFYAGKPQSMWTIASRLYGETNLNLIPRRRGDRGTEPFAHEEETAVLCDGPIRRLRGPHAGA
jgi:FlaA1/EpsC-like NDP-sugar epimerase